MRDKGRAVLEGIRRSLKPYGHFGRCTCSKCLHSTLDDPAVFWPLLREWCDAEKVKFSFRYSPATKWFYADIGGYECRSDLSEVEAGLKAWYDKLVALGKIREG